MDADKRGRIGFTVLAIERNAIVGRDPRPQVLMLLFAVLCHPMTFHRYRP